MSPKFAPAPVKHRGAAQQRELRAAAEQRRSDGEHAAERVRTTASAAAGGSRAGRPSRPAGSASTIGAAANSASSTPTAHSAWPSRSACSGAAMRTPAMHACRPIWPTISASSVRVTAAPSRHRATLARRPRAAPGSSCCARASGSASTLRRLRAICARADLGLHRSCCWLRRASSWSCASTSPNLCELGLHRAEHLPHLGASASPAPACESPSAGWSSVASSVVGPASVTRCSRCSASTRPGPAQRLGVQALGRHEQDREVGGVRRARCTSRGCVRASCRRRVSMRLARPPRRRRGRRAPARRAGARSPRAETCSRSAATAARRRRAGRAGGSRTRRARCCPARSRRWCAYCSGVNTCSSRPASCTSPNMPRVFTLVSTRLQRADVARQRLHLAQALVHLLEPVGHLLEAFAQALLERRLQLLVDGGAHLLELLLVAFLQRCEPLLDRRAHLRQAPLVAIGERAQLFVQRVAKALQRCVLRIARRLRLRRERLLQRAQLQRGRRRSARSACARRRPPASAASAGRSPGRRSSCARLRAAPHLVAQLALERARCAARERRASAPRSARSCAAAARAAARWSTRAAPAMSHSVILIATIVAPLNGAAPAGLSGVGGTPPVSAAIRLSAARFAIARRVGDGGARDVRRQHDVRHASAGRGAPSARLRTRRARPPRCALSRSAAASAASSTTPPRAMLVSVAVGFIKRQLGGADQVVRRRRVRHARCTRWSASRSSSSLPT